MTDKCIYHLQCRETERDLMEAQATIHRLQATLRAILAMSQLRQTAIFNTIITCAREALGDEQ